MLVDGKRRLEPFGILGDEPVRRIQEVLRRAPVLDERDGRVVGIRLAESGEVPERPAAPGEDRLIVVADHGDVVVRLAQKAEQLELRIVGVLEFVDEDVAKARAEPGRRRGVIAEEP